ncbi:3-deoxy-D-manno-octulosonic acid transferase [Salipiger sp. IMCC34102]|uniref:3-deoxy-D-manno-octulosonic acid transferase n=1 Tax=Salipiger sp. IMCC34102 TaxID=2510647 RepID=UPI0013EDE2EB|nr:3-deoxy-D-manno-octulosonic acid transferase [Salipiger sp. IMCC34102]
MTPPPALRAYGWAADAIAPLLFRKIRRKLASEGVPPDRIRERLGHPTKDRPPGPLVWFHGASVGETLSILPLIAPLRRARPDLTVLVTSGTAASATVLAQRLPEGALHQFAPIDSSAALARFHAHWRPDLLVLVESEIWPQLLASCTRRRVPVALLNARLSARSLRRWQRFGRPARWLLQRFSVIVTQTPDTTEALRDLGAPYVRPGPNLKAAAPPAPDAPALRHELAAAIGSRPVWLAASTHAGEEEIVLDAHTRLRQDHPEALLLLAPRHLDRTQAIEALCRARDLDLTRQSEGQAPAAAVHLVDTMGQLGTFYRLVPVTLIAGSFIPVGGHNPWEATCGTALLHGPLVANCATDYARLDTAGGSVEVTPETLAPEIAALWSDPGRARRIGEAAMRAKAAQSDGTEGLARDLLTLMESPA